MEVMPMPAIVEFPTVVKEALAQFGHLFANEPERIHFAEYLTGLLVADHKNVSAINRQFAVTTDQSCLNRWLTAADWDVEKLNTERLAWLQKDPSTTYSNQGVIALDNVLIDHVGTLIEDVGSFWDHAEQRFKIAHDYLIANYVCTCGKHYPLEFRRFVKKEQCLEAKTEFRDHNVLFRQLIDWVVGNNIPGDFTFDCWFTHGENLNHINSKGRGYVADLKFNRRVVFCGKVIKADELAKSILPDDRKPVYFGEHKQWYFTKSIRIDGVDHKLRIVILWDKQKDDEPIKIFVTNRTFWDVGRILRVYRRRWRGTECFHRDGKQHLGMGDCQLRNGQGQTRHMYMVFLAHSVLMRQLRQSRASEWALERLTTIGQSCWAVLRETLSQTISWAIDRIQIDGWSCDRIKVQLALP
jgi:hypothetical protein